MTAPVAGLIPCSVGGAMSADDLDVLVDRLCHPHAPKPATDALYRAQVALLYLAALMRRTANRAPATEKLIAALHECEAYLADREDVVDGDYGEPAPNAEMRLLREVRAALALERAKGEKL